jgi:hypothetical protein
VRSATRTPGLSYICPATADGSNVSKVVAGGTEPIGNELMVNPASQSRSGAVMTMTRPLRLAQWS